MVIGIERIFTVICLDESLRKVEKRPKDEFWTGEHLEIKQRWSSQQRRQKHPAS